jgi:hypothetical protein
VLSLRACAIVICRVPRRSVDGKNDSRPTQKTDADKTNHKDTNLILDGQTGEKRVRRQGWKPTIVLGFGKIPSRGRTEKEGRAVLFPEVVKLLQLGQLLLDQHELLERDGNVAAAFGNTEHVAHAFRRKVDVDRLEKVAAAMSKIAVRQAGRDKKNEMVEAECFKEQILKTLMKISLIFDKERLEVKTRDDGNSPLFFGWVYHQLHLKHQHQPHAWL